MHRLALCVPHHVSITANHRMKVKSLIDWIARLWMALGVAAFVFSSVLCCSLLSDYLRHGNYVTPHAQTASLFLPLPFLAIPACGISFWLALKTSANREYRRELFFSSTCCLIVGVALFVLHGVLWPRICPLAEQNPVSPITLWFNIGYAVLLLGSLFFEDRKNNPSVG